jgi:hypothetical protein
MMQHSTDFARYMTPDGYLGQVTRALLFIGDSRATGRLSLRNGERFGIIHLYFQAARLVHVAGNKHSAEEMLNDLLTWSKGDVRFDSDLLVPFESLTWQQAQLFGRWLAFLEMRGIMQGIARERLQGLAHRLTGHLPGEPIELPAEIAHYEEYNDAARVRQWQRLNEGVHQLVERAISEEQREQLKQTAQQLGVATQSVVKRLSRVAQEGISQAATTAQEAARQGTQRVEQLVQQSLNQERRQQFVQSMREFVESLKQESPQVK